MVAKDRRGSVGGLIQGAFGARNGVGATLVARAFTRP